MPHDFDPVRAHLAHPVADRHDVQLALEAGFSGEEVAFMFDLPPTVVVEVEAITSVDCASNAGRSAFPVNARLGENLR